MITENQVNLAIANKAQDRKIVDEYWDGEWHYEYEMYDDNGKNQREKSKRNSSRVL